MDESRSPLTDEQIRTEVVEEVRQETADADMDDTDTESDSDDSDTSDADSDDADS